MVESSRGNFENWSVSGKGTGKGIAACVDYSGQWHGFWRPFVKRFALCYQSVVCHVCLSVCDVCVLWPNGWMN